MAAEEQQDESGNELPANASEFAPVIFLDTNAVHQAVLTVSFCEEHNLDIATIDRTLFEQEVKDQGLVHTATCYKNGYYVLRYLLKRIQYEPDTEFWYSPMTRLELLCGGLRGEAIVSASKARVPNRWYSRLDEKEIRQYLEPSGYESVSQKEGANSELLERVGVTLQEATGNREVLNCAAELLQAVFVDVQDCVVYASAFELQVDEFISLDQYVNSIAEWISNPGSASADLQSRFQTAKSRMIKWGADVMFWQESDVKFPKVVKTKQMQSFVEGI